MSTPSIPIAWPRALDLLRSSAATGPLIVAGRPRTEGAIWELPSPADPGDLIRVHAATAEFVAEACAAADAARPACARLSRHARAGILRRTADAVEAQAGPLAELLTREVGKALRDSVGETTRAVATLRAAADAVTALAGTEVPLDAVPSGDGRIAYSTWEPVGVVAAVCGFNFPLLLAVHKVAAAIGAGCPVVVKPSDRTPLSALVLADAVVEAGWPAEAISVLPGGPQVGEALVADPVVRLVSFTGSSRIGAIIAGAAGRTLKRSVMELGSNTATVVAADADLDLAAERCAAGAMSASGQSCISVQRVFAEAHVARALAERIAARVGALRTGDPYDPATEVGALISPDATERVSALVADAVEHGAEVLAGGVAEGSLRPTVLWNPGPDARICVDEAFGPVLAVHPVADLDEAVARANATDYGLMAGVFTASLDTALSVASRLEAGGVHVNDSSNFRADNMPYGGVKHSGFGKEGPASAMREMSVEKIVTLRVATGRRA
ncbi:aldehyde dehydrogenase family protein [Pseudonocardia sp. C8]|uniref:aldehyde dehydrogenase family protein n=1 Tax=Pseudonocardia sp. C8 TaxID=2762759 RepID=UPI0016435FBD|nr:aldehyde dehydrogenase family protein [Pseudonocardia sp. C8]MBC3194513.1 aldehyde dehydrogenase family protein [Pseudonocardia sp. C8]